MRNPHEFKVTGAPSLDPFDLNWKVGPLPPNTFYWGGVIPKSLDTSSPDDWGFYFGDFRGDHVVVNPNSPQSFVVEAKDVLLYNNSLHMPPPY